MISDLRFAISDLQLPIADLRLPTTDFRFAISDCIATGRIACECYPKSEIANHQTEIGNRQSVIDNWQSAIGNRKSAIANQKSNAGFTLLELVMVMTIIVVLAAIGVTSYQSIQLKARETILRENLRTMRKMIDQYSADKEKLPSSLDDLAPDYIREIPVDPITGQKDWVVDMGEDTISRDGGTGVVDVHSAAAGESTDGTAYRDL
ncbi:MAG TPA: type II secretion system protein [Blastocatellia bacterium]|nr:type II secretion system protein [Blastocatellia bacterium]